MSLVASALVLIFRQEYLYPSLFLYTLSALVLVGGYWIPPLFHGIEKFGKWLGHAVGAAMTWALLAPFFYLCFWPGRLILTAMGKDPMRRGFEKDWKTYWNDKPKSEDPDRYTKQY